MKRNGTTTDLLFNLHSWRSSEKEITLSALSKFVENLGSNKKSEYFVCRVMIYTHPSKRLHFKMRYLQLRSLLIQPRTPTRSGGRGRR
jgi:hypothetical protein